MDIYHIMAHVLSKAIFYGFIYTVLRRERTKEKEKIEIYGKEKAKKGRKKRKRYLPGDQIVGLEEAVQVHLLDKHVEGLSAVLAGVRRVVHIHPVPNNRSI